MVALLQLTPKLEHLRVEGTYATDAQGRLLEVSETTTYMEGIVELDCLVSFVIEHGAFFECELLFTSLRTPILRCFVCEVEEEEDELVAAVTGFLRRSRPPVVHLGLHFLGGIASAEQYRELLALVPTVGELSIEHDDNCIEERSLISMLAETYAPDSDPAARLCPNLRTLRWEGTRGVICPDEDYPLAEMVEDENTFADAFSTLWRYSELNELGYGALGELRSLEARCRIEVLFWKGLVDISARKGQPEWHRCNDAKSAFEIDFCEVVYGMSRHQRFKQEAMLQNLGCKLYN